jgi:hypothetical protein
VTRETIDRAGIRLVSEAAIFAPNVVFTEWTAPAALDLHGRYERDGFVARGVFAPERIAALAAEADALLRRTM